MQELVDSIYLDVPSAVLDILPSTLLYVVSLERGSLSKLPAAMTMSAVLAATARPNSSACRCLYHTLLSEAASEVLNTSTVLLFTSTRTRPTPCTTFGKGLVVKTYGSHLASPVLPIPAPETAAVGKGGELCGEDGEAGQDGETGAEGGEDPAVTDVGGQLAHRGHAVARRGPGSPHHLVIGPHPQLLQHHQVRPVVCQVSAQRCDPLLLVRAAEGGGAAPHAEGEEGEGGPGGAGWTRPGYSADSCPH